ncbi:MAG: methyltransferase domain-containing protein [Anaerolineae bacterium]|nr:methyltransferase domain-containing protein [Anaerolineae bacterium]
MEPSQRKKLPPWIRLYAWATERLYYELAWTYDTVSWWVSLGHWDRWRRQALDHAGGGRVLEVGFGTGELLLEMKRRGWNVWGLDLSPAMQRVTARKLRRRALTLPRVRARTQTLPFGDGRFDAVVSTFPAPYILHPDTLREIARTLAPGGRLVISGLFSRVHKPWLRWLLYPIYGGATDAYLERFRELMAEAGFSVNIVEIPERIVSIPVLILEKMEWRP